MTPQKKGFTDWDFFYFFFGGGAVEDVKRSWADLEASLSEIDVWFDKMPKNIVTEKCATVSICDSDELWFQLHTASCSPLFSLSDAHGLPRKLADPSSWSVVS